jgi:acetoin utilization protein AcuB
MLAHEIMTRRPVTGTPRMTIRRALTVLRRRRGRHLPILRDGRLQGILSDRDLQRALAAGRAEDDPVADLVRTPAITAAPDTPVEEIARLLLDNKIGCVPIVWRPPGAPTAGSVSDAGDAGDTGEALVGIVTESDVFAAFMGALGITEPGSRVVVRLADPGADLPRVALALSGQAAPLLALSTEPLPAGPADAPGRPGLRLILRLGTINPRPIEAALAAAGLALERPDAAPSWSPAPAGTAPATAPAAGADSSRAD